MFADEHSEVLSVEGADVQQHGGTLEGPEAEGHVLSSERDVSQHEGRSHADVPRELQRLLDGVAHRRS